MWNVTKRELGGRTIQYAVMRGERAVSYAEALEYWWHDEGFRSFFNAVLADSPFRAFRWETPPITKAAAGRPFEFVLLDSPGLASTPDPGAFAEHFAGAPSADVVEFPNLGNDAVMVVPCLKGPADAYAHLGAFVRRAPEAQRHSLWRSVAAAMQRRLGESPVWLSTAGAGVSWLHVRLDSRPKYYGYEAYRICGGVL